ncbi:glycosyltransferase [Hymenobacter sp. PAMC 26628]|uniref:glycosyltransferase n=1 Tax=Hymenobacter sp. PAMC 26628 TaxID=1484118 RepID=UPI0007701EEB|nr:glycosyltransferase [Hymenobacter sp. PAMC 26628]AMJ67851.1 hypothetical protein AXW84_22345 [Hymenobacter sp. PAMC 26628]
MIFITIGTQAPFNRLIKIIDSVAKQFPNDSFIAQTLNGSYEPSNLTTVNFLTPRDFDDLFNDADLIISHAGMGTIISALTRNKPLLVMPRQATLSEHRNDHQLATAKKFQELNCIHVARNELELSSTLTKMLDDKILTC